MNREFTDEILAQGFDDKDLAEKLAPLIWEWALDNKNKILDKYEMDFCYHCDDFVEPELHEVSGRVGHIDNWLPDEVYSYCPDCGRGLK